MSYLDFGGPGNICMNFGISFWSYEDEETKVCILGSQAR